MIAQGPGINTPSHSPPDSLFFLWSSISVCRGAAGNCWFLLRHPQEQIVCHSPRCRASYPAQSGTFICKYICNIDIKIQISAIIMTCHCYKISPNDCRIRPAPLECSQQGSGCNLLYPPALSCSAALHWSSSLSPPLPPHQRKACHLDMAAGCHGSKHCCCDNGFLWHMWWPSQQYVTAVLSLHGVREAEKGRGVGGRGLSGRMQYWIIKQYL